MVISEKDLRNQILFLMVEKGVAVMSKTYYSKKNVVLIRQSFIISLECRYGLYQNRRGYPGRY